MEYQGRTKVFGNGRYVLGFHAQTDEAIRVTSDWEACRSLPSITRITHKKDAPLLC